MIKLRIDVDYPYPSRFQSFLFATLNRRTGKNYLKNAKILAKMINESPEEIRAFWFFTPQTTPETELLSLLHPDRHEVALHVANNPYRELELLENATHRKVKYYTVHGTARLFARLMWRRKIWEAKAPIPTGFPLKSFYDFPTMHLDTVCYHNSVERAVRIAEENIVKGDVLHFHPEWLFNRGTLNHRGPYYEPLRRLLKVDKELELLTVRKKVLARIAKYSEQYEYLQDFAPSKKFLEKLMDRGIDLFTFIERKWCSPIANPSPKWLKTEDNIALLQVTSFSEWWEKVGKKTRNMVRKAEKSGIITEVVQPTEKLAKGIWKIYNETPIRQGRAFSHFGWTLQNVIGTMRYTSEASTYLGAFLEGELVGFIQLVHGDKIVVVSQILSLQKFWDKAVNNALIAKAVDICASNHLQWLMYGRMGNHPSLDNFKLSNGFSKFSLTRYYVPLTGKGRLAAKLGLHRPAKDALPENIKLPLIPLFNWVSRTKMQVRLRLRSRKA